MCVRVCTAQRPVPKLEKTPSAVPPTHKQRVSPEIMAASSCTPPATFSSSATTRVNAFSVTSAFATAAPSCDDAMPDAAASAKVAAAVANVLARAPSLARVQAEAEAVHASVNLARVTAQRDWDDAARFAEFVNREEPGKTAAHSAAAQMSKLARPGLHDPLRHGVVAVNAAVQRLGVQGLIWGTLGQVRSGRWAGGVVEFQIQRVLVARASRSGVAPQLHLMRRLWERLFAEVVTQVDAYGGVAQVRFSLDDVTCVRVHGDKWRHLFELVAKRPEVRGPVLPLLACTVEAGPRLLVSF